MSSAQDSSPLGVILQLLGAGAFGSVIGWYAYFINRYRKDEIQLSDLSTLLGILGGGAVLALFKAQTALFGAYGIGLAVGFFGYFASLLLMVKRSQNFGVDWFLDGRRKKPADDQVIPAGTAVTVRPMAAAPGAGPNLG